MFDYTAKRREAERNQDLATLQSLEAPDILQKLYQLERFEWRHLPWPGGLDDQPYLLMYELECAEGALAMQAQMQRNQDALTQSVQHDQLAQTSPG